MAEAKPCRTCGDAIVNRRPNAIYCIACAPPPGKKRDVPCADCGRLLFGGTTSLPPGQRRCQPCRRANPSKPKRWDPGPPIQCPTCAVRFTKTWWAQIYCQPSCRRRKPRPSDGSHKHGPGRSCRPWERLKRQVWAEEPDCWICGEPMDYGMYPHPHPRSRSVDHLTPLSLGGAPEDRDNVKAAHLGCNRQRQAQARR